MAVDETCAAESFLPRLQRTQGCRRRQERGCHPARLVTRSAARSHQSLAVATTEFRGMGNEASVMASGQARTDAHLSALPRPTPIRPAGDAAGRKAKVRRKWRVARLFCGTYTLERFTRSVERGARRGRFGRAGAPAARLRMRTLGQKANGCKKQAPRRFSSLPTYGVCLGNRRGCSERRRRRGAARRARSHGCVGG